MGDKDTPNLKKNKLTLLMKTTQNSYGSYQLSLLKDILFTPFHDTVQEKEKYVEGHAQFFGFA